mgnify:CR=1 FL=1
MEVVTVHVQHVKPLQDAIKVLTADGILSLGLATPTPKVVLIFVQRLGRSLTGLDQLFGKGRNLDSCFWHLFGQKLLG